MVHLLRLFKNYMIEDAKSFFRRTILGHHLEIKKELARLSEASEVQKKNYQAFILREEEKYFHGMLPVPDSRFVHVVGYDDLANKVGEFRELFTLSSYTDIIIFAKDPKALDPKAIPYIYRAFMKDDNLQVLYGAEDEISENGLRFNPIFKPAWSPEYFEKDFYFGSYVAIRNIPENVIFLQGYQDGQAALYAALRRFLVSKVLKREDFLSVTPVLYHGKTPYQKLSSEMISNIRKKGMLSNTVENALVSIIVPSKDHPKLLWKLLWTLKKTAYKNFEVIIVDNGSSLKNQKKIKNILKLFSFKIKYILDEAPFNYSKMNNIGAKEASGKYLLLLNDDIEIFHKRWLSRMILYASRVGVGAVGAKLLYPDRETIQHVGVLNLPTGPMHPLIYQKNFNPLAYGMNEISHNCLAVTGACLLVPKEAFDSVDGFDENLAVAYNDVDLCLKLYEKGYRNIIRPEAMLVHHESVSRGADALSEEKKKRLDEERNYLYEKHPLLLMEDPYLGYFRMEYVNYLEEA